MMVTAIKESQGIEEKLRTDKFKDDFFSLLEKDVNELINPYRASFAKINCPCCDRRETPEAFVKGQFSFHACPDCDTLFINPRPTKKTLDNFYINSKAIALFTRELMKNEKSRTKYIFERRARQVLDFLGGVGKTTGRLVEIGCSIGTFLEIIKEKNRFSVEGVDPDDGACRACAAKGIKAHKTTLESFRAPSSRYDIALNFETIEHIFSPYEFLRKINQLLKKGGYLGFTTPNRHGFDMMTLGQSYKNIHGPCHLNYFNVDTIDLLLKRCGFKVVKKMTPGILDIEVVRKQILAGVAPTVPPFIKYIACEADDQQRNNFQEYLRNNRLSGNMLIFAQKTGKGE
ncbi:MAG: class I SAM-dependent methyltransferase [Candidatus Margulisbacteria bacterium]|nr:class I SAM-dependent methyltransferase [Candidatus Margulisiibacteriota bacterium]MBU1616424.1 class I SAM-dependent methyltransferase [Candidatus Margulisiibacteriota bacterium]